MRTDDGSWPEVQGRSQNRSRSHPHDPGVGRGDAIGGDRVIYRAVAAAASGERGIGRIAQPLAVRAELEVSGFVLEAVQRLPLHRALNLRRTPDSSERREGGSHSRPQHWPWSEQAKVRRSPAQVRRGECDRVAQCAAVEGVAVVRPGPRRRSSKYAAAVRPVKRRSPAWAGTGAVCTPATERGFWLPGLTGCGCGPRGSPQTWGWRTWRWRGFLVTGP
jgi:hypothetical protein